MRVRWRCAVRATTASRSGLGGLRVVLLHVDVPARAVLHAVHLSALGLGDGAVGLVLGLDLGDVRLLLVEAVRLARREPARSDAGVDARLLVRFALVDARRRGVARRGGGRGDRQRDADGGNRELVHGALPWCAVESQRWPSLLDNGVFDTPTTAPG